MVALKCVCYSPSSVYAGGYSIEKSESMGRILGKGPKALLISESAAYSCCWVGTRASNANVGCGLLLAGAGGQIGAWCLALNLACIHKVSYVFCFYANICGKRRSYQ